jgi:DNA-binding XRE family transcriptional regulator
MEKSKLIEARNNKGWTQTTLGEKIGMSQTSYNRREKGFVAITTKEWDKIVLS